MDSTLTKIADINIKINRRYQRLDLVCATFKSKFTEPDIEIDISQQEIDEARKNDTKYQKRQDDFFEEKVAFRKISDEIKRYDAFVFHGALISVNGEGIIFCAASGTGKTTHMMLWRELLGEQMLIINGDKPIIRFFDGVPFAYGNPWNGKEHLGCNNKVELKHICFIERSDINTVVPLSKNDLLSRIANQMAQPLDSAGVLKNYEFINGLIQSCDYWLIKCNMEIDAAKTAYNTIFSEV